MNSQTQNPNPNTPPPTYHDWREQRHAERMARHEADWQRHAGRPYGWLGGAFLILLGVIILLQYMGFRFLPNWWALFILLPAIWAFLGAWNIYQDNSRITQGAAGSLTLGILLTILTLSFLLNLAFGLFWPILLIVGGLVLLLTGFFSR